MDRNIKTQIDKIINHFNAGNYKEVFELSDILLKKNPELDFVLNIVGLCYQKLNDFDKAEICFSRAININKKNINAITNIANNFKYKLDFNKADEFYKKSLRINPNHVSALLNYGNLKFLINDHKNGLDLLNKALNINDKLIPVHLNLAIIYQSLGDFKKALKHLDLINDLDPTFTRSDKMKSVLVNYKEKNDHLTDMKSKLDRLDLNDDQKIYLYFGISKAFEDCKNFEESFKYIQLGNNLKFKNSNYDIKFDTDKIEKIQKIFDKIDFNYLSNENEKLKPIFIIGMPRSGTSLVEQIISSHQKVQGLGELNFFNNVANKEFIEKNIFNHYDLKIENVKHIANRFDLILKNFNVETEKFTDKTLLNFYWVGLIKLCYPNAKIIHCTRNPKDNLLSIYKNLFDHEGGWCYDEENLVQYYKIYNRIINYWKTKIPNFLSDIKYEDLITEPKLHIKNLLKYCDLEWDDNCLEFYKNKNSIKTLSVKQARNQIYKSSIDSFKNYKNIAKDLFKSL